MCLLETKKYTKQYHTTLHMQKQYHAIFHRESIGVYLNFAIEKSCIGILPVKLLDERSLSNKECISNN